MSIGVQNSGINISNAELSRLVDVGMSEQGDKVVRDDGRALVRADAALAAVVGARVSPQRDADAGAQRVELTQPKPAAQTLAMDRQTVSGIEREHKRLAASQMPAVTGMHDALVQRHASLADAKASGDEAPRAAAGGPQRFSFASDKGFDALLAFGVALQKNVQSDLVMQGKLTMLAHNAMMSAAEQDRRIGAAQMTAAITGGVLQATTSLGGAVQQMRGLNTKAGSIENELKPQAELKKVHAEQSLELRGVNKPVVSSDGASHVNVKHDTGKTTRHEINQGGDGVSDEHTNRLMKEAANRQHTIDMQGARHEQNQLKAGHQQMKGDLTQSSGQISKNVIDGSSAQQQGADRAEQRMDESAQQTAMAMASARDEAAHRSRDAAQKALDAAKSQIANSNAVAAQVAGNLRA
ncbi:IpaC/SipC family type III secretion system effector [Burkholderia oklahomensis]|uniref:Effector protein BipC n=1 Tax=Burkholderia oklahomensis TaxID=342113 RepID=A0AAI8BAE8_9BURK|nr:IpaC/SipC family type III secretion system effector [Burkholderia oklahomensis]AIO68496.1 type III secretion target, IpaC/SipC family protein [Burkholderia oklahomensis]AOI38819.1 restriction endonuclease [Burkholderia oklahomensis EO147]KUY63329.1 restriction endonuclease [Burkholderia oklahomensis EO147]QPS40832.1 IpaC/SipC family type III secretion system effector [Burkholderia oklahomensis]